MSSLVISISGFEVVAMWFVPFWGKQSERNWESAYVLGSGAGYVSIAFHILFAHAAAFQRSAMAKHWISS